MRGVIFILQNSDSIALEFFLEFDFNIISAGHRPDNITSIHGSNSDVFVRDHKKDAIKLGVLVGCEYC